MAIEDSEDESVETQQLSLPEILSRQSLLGLIYSRAEIDRILQQHPAVAYQEGSVLADEGESAQFLYIPISGELRVKSSAADSMDFEQGELATGRSFNLYALLRDLPFQYRLVARSDAEVLKIPWSLVQSKVEGSPVLKSYLFKVTESADFHFLRRDIEEAGCSLEFRITLISALEVRKLPKQRWIVSQGQTTTDAIMFVRGDVIAISHDDSKSSLITGRWNQPLRVWVNWMNMAEANPIPISYSMRSQTDVEYFALPSAAIAFLKEKYPQDFHAWSRWVSSAQSHRAGDQPTEIEQSIDLEEFLNTTKFRRAPWKLFPWVQQNDQMDCAAACLTMIGQFFGGKHTIQFWRSQLSTDQSGTSLFDICKTAEKNGLLTHALHADSIEEIPANAYPVIVIRQYHYVVLYAKRGSKYVIGDPGVGIRKVDEEWLNDGFEKAYVVIRPSSDFNGTKSESAKSLSFWEMLAPFRSEIGMAFIAAMLMVAISVIPPIVTQNILDDVLSTSDLDLLKYCFIALISFTVFNAFLNWAKSYFLEYVAVKLDFVAKSSFLHRLMKLPYEFFANRHVGDFTRRLQEFQTVRSFLTEKSLDFGLSIFSLIVYLSVLFAYSAKVGLLVLCLAPVFLIVSAFFTKSLISAYAQYFAAQSEEDGYVADLIRGMLAVKTNAAELSLRRIYEVLMVNALKERYRFKISAVWLNGVVSLVYELSRYSLLGMAVWLAIRGELTAGQVVAISMLAVEVLGPFQKMALHWADFQEAKMIISRLNDVYLSPLESVSSAGVGQRTQKIEGQIEFRDVWFRYGGEASEWVLKGVSFVISSGTKVAICGPSGSGKSTIAMLLARVYTAQKGQILLDGRDINDYDLAWLRQRIGYVPQESHLFPGTVASNIALSGESFSEDSLNQAAELADARGFIENKPIGFQTYIPAGGHGFSGGEKQRLSLARVLHRDPDLLILDEATSALDGLSERRFLQRVNEWGEGKSIVSIAHRFSTVVRSEVVILMLKGKVHAVGSPQVLAKTDKLFKDLFQMDLGNFTEHMLSTCDEAQAEDEEQLESDSDSDSDETAA